VRNAKPTLLTPWGGVLLKKLSGPHRVEKLSAFYRHPGLTTAPTTSHLSLSWARSIPFTHSHLFLRHILILTPPSTPRSSKWSLSFRFPHQKKTCMNQFFSHTCHMSQQSYSWFVHLNNIWGEVQTNKELTAVQFVTSVLNWDLSGT